MNKNPDTRNCPDARMRLIEAAIDLFAEKGYTETPVREIVERAGVTKPVLYYYFKNKEGLFMAILDWASELQEEFLESLLEIHGNTLDRFIKLYKGIYKGVMEHRDLFKMINNLVFGPPQGISTSLLNHFHLRMVDAIKKIYKDGLAKNEVVKEDPEDVAIVVLGLLDTCLHMDNLYPDKEDPERPGRLLRIAFNGLSMP
ncbi:TetR/AcrR family transcriptional regulator [Thermodesulfobacteriota bacterium]